MEVSPARRLSASGESLFITSNVANITFVLALQ
jgi:hypothetical protein